MRCRQTAREVVISIHALREEGDAVVDLAKLLAKQFLSTPSARRATAGKAGRRTAAHISIHALREEGDRCLLHCP